LAIKSKQ